MYIVLSFFKNQSFKIFYVLFLNQLLTILVKNPNCFFFWGGGVTCTLVDFFFFLSTTEIFKTSFFLKFKIISH